MQMVRIAIELNDVVLDRIKRHKYDFRDSEDARMAIRNGTIIPKGHGRIGDLDKAAKKVKEYSDANKNADDMFLAGCGDGAYHSLRMIEAVPAIIEAEKEADE